MCKSRINGLLPPLITAPATGRMADPSVLPGIAALNTIGWNHMFALLKRLIASDCVASHVR